jgi:hypothetical protein
VHVQVDHAGHERRVAEIDRSLRLRVEIADGDDLGAANQHGSFADHPHSVEDSLGANEEVAALGRLVVAGAARDEYRDCKKGGPSPARHPRPPRPGRPG